ncbi:MAG: NADH-quinone oxidoreductase subunit G [Proteobacteria bacterium]|nr:NADH-quinone oxidoreductase subunit G [Pseudomonadota bacterium]
MVTIEIDDKKVEARPGQMIIEAADSVGIQIPRFCYHKKLSIAANCRMCLVDVEKAPKPLPACATPVSDGMKIFTKSTRAVEAQKAVMEFLLINHPLDCPICDQGGQCELQDVALEYGKDRSRFVERKRVVKDKDIGPLISTEMTRCIHCTRCVRFGSEIAGQRELGATGRGEFMEIGTYIEKSVNSELSGNVIDLCPVGALTSKPFRFQARAWELQANESISMHDCIGSHLYFHTQNNQVKRTLPREYEPLNEVWLSDRDRFSYEALNHQDRLASPWIKRDNHWKKVDWPTALSFAVESLQKVMQSQGAEAIGALASPNCTVEEFFLLQKLLKSQDCYNIDHRLRHVDNKHQSHMGSFPTLGIWLSGLEEQENIVIVGANVKKEQPIVNLRIRKASLHGAKVFGINPYAVDHNYNEMTHFVSPRGDFYSGLMEVVKALMALTDKEVLADCPPGLEAQLSAVNPSEKAKEIAKQLKEGQKNSVILGAYGFTHPKAHQIYWLSRILAHLCGATFGEMSHGANSAGGYLAGAIPHRMPFGQVDHVKVGLDVNQMLEKPRQGYLLVNCEPEFDCVDPALAKNALLNAKTVVALSAYDSPQLREVAQVLLPITPVSEMSGTYINAFGEWASFKAAITPFAQSRPAWKVLRVMANLWDISGFEYQTSEDILAELLTMKSNTPHFAENLLSMECQLTPNQHSTKLVRLAPMGLYHVDGITRRAHSLQKTQDANMAKVSMNVAEAKNLNLKLGQKVWVFQGKAKSLSPLPLHIDDTLPNGVAIVPGSIHETQSLGAPFGLIDIILAEEEA